MWTRATAHAHESNINQIEMMCAHLTHRHHAVAATFESVKDSSMVRILMIELWDP